MGIHDTGKLDVFSLAAVGFFKEVCVTGEENAAKLCGSIQKVGIGLAKQAIILNSPYINASFTKTACDDRRHVFVRSRASGSLEFAFYT
jgi:hypothetical protein